ncbi:MAG: 4Fe-4S dicluster domain-containing protein [Candidatus Zixiibacteriota bacterium]
MTENGSKPSEDVNKPNEAETEENEPSTKYVYDGKTPPLNIFLHWCKACNLCIAFCPQKVFEPDREGKPMLAHPEKCTQCAICWLHCPDFAITSNYK